MSCQFLSFSTSSSSATYNGNPHPRDFIRTHKAELETWDTYAWKQALGTFDALRDAWEARKREVEARVGAAQRDMQVQMQQMQMGYYAGQMQQEVGRLQGVSGFLGIVA